MPFNEARLRQRASPTLDANPKTPTILVIDDDAEIRYSLSRVLSSRGYAVSEAASGEQGIAMVKKGPHPDLIFLDIRMTGMSGLEAPSTYAPSTPSSSSS
jgi:CheY-like chemotaxis protein